MKKSLYGLRCAPKRCGTTRDGCSKTSEIMDDDLGVLRCIQCPHLQESVEGGFKPEQRGDGILHGVCG
eukprot:685550-Prorocentrum_lima.AAC.1